MEKEGANTVQSVRRALLLLEVISEEKEIGIRDLSKRTGLKRSTVQRIIATLEEANFLLRNYTTQKYRLSFKLFQIGHSAIQQMDIVSVARPILEKLMVEVKETVVLGILDDGDLIYIDKLSYPHEIHLTTTVGSRVPAHCTGTGKAILAHLPEEERMQVLTKKTLRAYTPNTITDIDELEKEFSVIRKRGFSIDNEERFPGVVSVAAPIRDYQGRVKGAVGVPGFIYRISPERISFLGQVVLRVSKEISCRLGFNPQKETLSKGT